MPAAKRMCCAPLVHSMPKRRKGTHVGIRSAGRRSTGVVADLLGGDRPEVVRDMGRMPLSLRLTTRIGTAHKFLFDKASRRRHGSCLLDRPPMKSAN